jgi:hypothetical protein
MSKVISVLLLSISGIAVAAAGDHKSNWWGDWGDHDGNRHGFSAPEIDPSSAITALTLLVGGVTVLRGRSSKKQA